jgi:hypothetical protein
MSMAKPTDKLDLDRLLKLRLVVARFGEVENAGWWGTKDILGKYGALALSRGFPRTHLFAQARIAFAAATHRCNEIFNPPGCMTLWNMPALIEDQFDERWQHWLEHVDEWCPFFKRLEDIPGNLLMFLMGENLLTPALLEQAEKLRRAGEGKAVPIPGSHSPSDDIVTLLAAGFAKGEPGKPAIPYARVEE